MHDVSAAIVVSDNADGVLWWTGTSSAYLPQEEVALTGEHVDTEPLWQALPCALEQSDAVVVLIGGTFVADTRTQLEALVDAGWLIPEPGDDATVYRPVPDAC